MTNQFKKKILGLSLLSFVILVCLSTFLFREYEKKFSDVNFSDSIRSCTITSSFMNTGVTYVLCGNSKHKIGQALNDEKVDLYDFVHRGDFLYKEENSNLIFVSRNDRLYKFTIE